ncbi:MAG: SGNH/GDSL hydrolase family protein [Rhizobiales bacterium]|nr:SGNH/GDSL hydrolase family protein [Hyphomicrobiales bacterium]
MNWPAAALVVLSLLCLLLAGSLTSAVMGARSFFQDRSELRLRPIDPGRFTEANRALQSSGKDRIVIFGDSRAHQTTVSGDTGSAWQVVSRGVSGESSVQASYRFQNDVIDLRPRVVLIVTGINDAVAAANLPGMERAAVANLKANVSRFAQEAAASGAVAIVSTIVRPTTPRLIRRPFWSDRVYAIIDEVNAHIRGLAADNVLILDADELLVGDKTTLPWHLATDEVHLSKEAHELLAARLDEILRPLRPGAAH